MQIPYPCFGGRDFALSVQYQAVTLHALRSILRCKPYRVDDAAAGGAFAAGGEEGGVGVSVDDVDLDAGGGHSALLQ